MERIQEIIRRLKLRSKPQQDIILESLQMMLTGYETVNVKHQSKISSSVPAIKFDIEPFSLFSDIRPYDDRLIRFLSSLWIGDDPLHSNWDELAYEENLSLSRLNVICRTETSYTVQKVSELFAIEKCKTELKNTNKSITEIGMDHGFENPSYFAKKFKEIVGISPRCFRLQATNCSMPVAKQPYQNI